MEQVNKYDFEERQLKDSLIRVGDLINMDGPMLALFTHSITSDLYLFDWVDNNETSNRWLIYKVDKNDLISFLKTKISYKTLFERNAIITYYTDIENFNFSHNKIYCLKSIPVEYGPDKDVLFDLGDSKNFEKILKVLNLDSDLNEFDLSKEYNCVIVTTGLIDIPFQNMQDYANSFVWTPSVNVLGKTRTSRIYGQSNASKGNRIPQKERVVS